MPADDFDILKWVIGGIAILGVLSAKFFNSKIDRKVSKEVYEEFKKGNDLQHGITHSALKEIKEDNRISHEKLLYLVGTKQDKKG